DLAPSFHHFRDDKKAVRLSRRVAQRLLCSEPVTRRVLAEDVKIWAGMRGRLDIAYVCLAKFFDVLQYIIQLLLKNFRLGFSQIDARQPGNICDIEVGSFSHGWNSRMQVADEPHDCGGKRGQKKQKNGPAFSPFFAQRTTSPRGSAGLEGVSAVQRERDLKSFFDLFGSYALFRLCRRSFPRGRPPFCNHALEPVELVA